MYLKAKNKCENFEIHINIKKLREMLPGRVRKITVFPVGHTGSEEIN